ncbi:alpha/beta fold hydrolase [Streptomyces huasconensis]|uniref:alpha/beta fold hydrolase n=1 Tax=Streptomyces huasconensis TaxID=1854574 RepID=UPI0036F8C21E
MALLIGELADSLKLGDETVFVENDGGRLQQSAAERPQRVSWLVLAGCEAFDNYPPRADGKMMTAAARIPGGVAAMAHGLAFRPARRIPGTGYAVMAHKPVAHDVTDRWTEPLRKDPAARRVLVRCLRAARPSEMREAAEGPRAHDRPGLVVWGRRGRMMPPEHGRRPAELLPQGRLVELDDCRTLIPLDRPEGLAAAIRDFAARTSLEGPLRDPLTRDRLLTPQQLARVNAQLRGTRRQPRSPGPRRRGGVKTCVRARFRVSSGSWGCRPLC